MSISNKKVYIGILFFLYCTIAQVAQVYAFSPERYVANSVLAEGTWVKIEVTETGMQFISNSDLKKWGFEDPAKVNVYGYGGRRISEVLNDKHPDDLPLLPVCRTNKGIVFYGVNTISWQNTGHGAVPYVQKQNIYSTGSYYFVSDREIEKRDIELLTNPVTEQSILVTSFIERLMHEKEQYAVSNTGSLLAGEDFRTNSSQTFSFNLPGQVDETVNVLVDFIAKTTNGQSSLTFKANSKSVNATSSDKIAAITNAETHFRSTSTYKKLEEIKDRLDLQINFSSSGVLYAARLNYITVNYKRELKLADGKLLFHYNVPDDTTITFKINGCGQNTLVWDVTEPQKPRQIVYDLENGVATFSPKETGEREYVAFNSEQVSKSPKYVGTVANQNLHALPVPDMVIITLPEYYNQAKRVAQLHEEVDGMLVHVVNQQDVFNEFSSGAPDFSAFRKIMKMWYDRSTTENKLGYCLLFGRPSYDNRMITDLVRSSGYNRMLVWQSEESSGENSSYCTDDLIGMLEDCTDDNFSMSSGVLSVAVGRMPVKNVAEAEIVVNKLIKYVKEPNYGVWRNNVMLIADDGNNGDHLDQAESVYSKMNSTGNGRNFIYEKLYIDSYPLVTSSTGRTYPAAKERMMQMFEDGVMYVDYIGHANPTSWTHERLLTYSDILEMNYKNLPFFATYTCEFTRWDADEISGAEIMWLNENGGAIGFISAIRKVFISNNGVLNDAISEELFRRDENGLAMRFGDIYRIGKNKIKKAETNKLKYMFMGDPALRLPSPAYSITVDSLAGVDMANIEDLPIIPARGKVVVKGRVVDQSGLILSDFNGIIVPTLFDAERPIKTAGNAEDDKGAVRIYNDRKNKLFTSQVPVVNGEWEATILMPSEIDNNYSPALLNLYAWSEDGREANGSTTDFYVYGWDENAEEDLDGPNINLLALNSDAFKDGGVVNDSPVLLAHVQDDSGINISTSGIGHQMTVVLDGEKVYDDLVNYYQPDVSDYTAGNVIYQLTELAEGEHTLVFKVWDNANNSSSKTLNFKVSKTVEPKIYDIYTNANPASTSATFFISHDRPSTMMTVTLDIFDMGGQKVWSKSTTSVSDFMTPVQIDWNLTDMAGRRVQRGIYLYRATISIDDSQETTMTKKIAVTAQ